MTTRHYHPRILGAELKVGDELWTFGQPRKITHLEDYKGPLAKYYRGCTRLAWVADCEVPWLLVEDDGYYSLAGEHV